MGTEIGLEIKVENFEKIIDELNNMFIISVTEDIAGRKFSHFINGISRTKDGTHICDILGNIYKTDGLVVEDFSCGRAKTYFADKNEYGFVNEQGKSIGIRSDYAKHYANNLAPIKLIDTDFKRNENWCYIDLAGQQASPQMYKKATPFKDGYAMVYTMEGTWQYIDDKFNVITRYNNKWYDLKKVSKTYNFINKDQSCFIENPIEIIYHQEYGFYISMIDKQTGLNPSIDKFVMEVASKYGILITGKNNKERLLCLINALSKIGKFILPYGVLDIIPHNQEMKIKKNPSRIRIISGGTHV